MKNLFKKIFSTVSRALTYRQEKKSLREYQPHIDSDAINFTVWCFCIVRFQRQYFAVQIQ